MKNKEKYKEELLNIACHGYVIGVDATSLEPFECDGGNCHRCIAYTASSCHEAISEWANNEYIEQCSFIKDEIVEVSEDGIRWCLRHFAYLKKGQFYFYIVGRTSKETNDVITWKYCKKYGTLGKEKE